MNPASESKYYSSDPTPPIIEGEILQNSDNSEKEILDFDLICLDTAPPDSEEDNPSVFLKLTPWGVGAIALFLFANLLLTWAQFSPDPIPEIGQKPSDILPSPEINPPSPTETKNNLEPTQLSTLPPVKQPIPIPPPQQPNPSPPQPTLAEKLLPPTLRPQSIPVTQKQTIPALPTAVVPLTRPSQTALPQPQRIPAPPPPSTALNQAPIAPNFSELPKDDQLRNILRQQLIREEANYQPEQTFNQRVREKLLESKMRKYRATQEAQAVPTGNNEVIPAPPPPSSQTSATVPPAPLVAPQPTQATPRNVNDLVNTLESFNQK
ncbi:MAG: hypothetical protein AB4058_00040 [Microcystaceae cyanobacterium]